MTALTPRTYDTPELVFGHDRTAFIVDAKNETPPLEIYVDQKTAKTEKGWAYIKGPETVSIPVTPGKHVLTLYGGGQFWPGKSGYTVIFPETAAPEPAEVPQDALTISFVSYDAPTKTLTVNVTNIGSFPGILQVDGVDTGHSLVADGNHSVVFPDGLAAGEHKAVARVAIGNRTARVDFTVDEPKPTEEPAEEPAAEEPAPEPVKEPAEEPTEETNEEPAENPAEPVPDGQIIIGVDREMAKTILELLEAMSAVLKKGLED